MNSKQALHQLICEKIICFNEETKDEELRQALIKALKKDIAMPPIVMTEIDYSKARHYKQICPTCKKLLVFDYPCKCGQRIEWTIWHTMNCAGKINELKQDEK